LKSIYDDSKRKDKTQKNKPTRKVDLISSDEVASAGDIGESVGAYAPIEGIGGLFELRSLPYVDIADKANVKKVFETTLDSYGGMD
jgi:hypothetical protein